MTVSPPPPAPSKELQAARKRRRRAPAGGAADDCFACIKRGTKCDRRRPYCSQCLEFGNECSGYKTQLTWGVGVASRGKLRGLSLPIASAAPVQPAPKKTSSRARASSNATSQWSNDSGDRSPKSYRRDSVEVRSSHLSASVPTTPYQQFNEYPRFPLSSEQAPVSTQTHWGSLPAFVDQYGHESAKYHKINTTLSQFSMMGEPMSAPVDSLSDVDYTISPMAHSFPREEHHFMSSPTIIYEGYGAHSSPPPHSPASAIMINQRSTAPSCPSLVYAPSEHSSSLSSHHDVFDSHMAHRLITDNDTLSVPELDSYSTSPHSSVGGFWPPPSLQDESKPIRPVGHIPSHAALPLETNTCLQVSPDLIAKMPFFMDYYEKTMCPSMVLIDSPTNPYRNHILQLASSSRSLQHAICALAACNLRMKRRLSLGQHSREFLLGETGNNDLATGDDPTLSEELQHRNLAITLLNEQLNDPAKASHDSVLATILLLCHYRMVESGIAKFHTQFAGVKKILSMRGHGSSSSAWMEAVFTYFDSISASINDREAQLSHGFFGLSTDAHLIPAGAENWVGCDHELFKTIGKLGRLNLLSQHRPVQSNMDVSGVCCTSPIGSPLGQSFKQSSAQVTDFFSIPTSRFDGNGFSTPLNHEQLLSSSMCSSPDYDDLRSNFWREWKDARTALQSWEFDSQRVAASLPESATPGTLRDLGHLSEAFRYAALLYTERLASPLVPSSHNAFRNLVSQIVYYATSIEAGSGAEKFLLWPMFIAGSECVNEVQQNYIRNKCRDIMARSGYMNNMSAIEVLERLWAGEYVRPSEMAPGAHIGPGRGPFSWTKCIGGRGVDVEWIMF